jgi:hypothetical protein
MPNYKGPRCYPKLPSLSLFSFLILLVSVFSYYPSDILKAAEVLDWTTRNSIKHYA